MSCFFLDPATISFSLLDILTKLSSSKGALMDLKLPSYKFHILISPFKSAEIKISPVFLPIYKPTMAS